MEQCRLIAIVDLKDLDGEILLIKNHVYNALSELHCNKVKVKCENNIERFINSCLLKTVE